MAFSLPGKLLAVMLLFALLVAQIGQYITVAPPSSVENQHSSASSFKSLGRDEGEIFVFVQVSDLHISMFRSPDRYNQLKEFCRINLQVIKPRLVLASGDLTDAMDRDLITGKQNIEEWQMYKDFYKQCLAESGISNWLDIRGNHDNFNVDGYNGSSSFYPKYGAQGDRPPGSYMMLVRESSNTNYAFIAVDATLNPGPIRAMNFIGELDKKNLKKLEEFQTVVEQVKVNGSFWFGHYPTSSIMLSRNLRSLASKSIAYFCGHLHTLFGLVPHMYSPHHSGMLELELADWKDNRMYRIAVIDHGLFSFADLKHNVWPAVVVTNPKPLITVQRSKEPFHLAESSSHIRFLIFSPSAIDLCEVRIDEDDWQTCQRTGKNRPLYTSPWDAAKYSKGLHVLEIRARDTSGLESLTKVEFALDGTSPNFFFLSRFILMVDITLISQVIFGFAIALCIIPGCYFRIQQSRILERKSTLRRFKYRWAHVCFRGLWIYANIDVLFYTISFYTIYLAFGPWFVGHITDGRVGVVFVWGTIFSDYFLPGSLTYYSGVWHTIAFNYRIIAVLAYIVNDRFRELIIERSSQQQNQQFLRKYRKLVTFMALFGPQAYLNYCFFLSYGLMATLINPMMTWVLFLVFYLWRRAERLSRKELEEICKVWT